MMNHPNDVSHARAEPSAHVRRLAAFFKRHRTAARLVRFGRSFSRAALVLLCLLLTAMLFAAGFLRAADTETVGDAVIQAALPPCDTDPVPFFGRVLASSLPMREDALSHILRGETKPPASPAQPDADSGDAPSKSLVDDDAVKPEDLYAVDRTDIPAGAHALVPMNLSGHPARGEVLLSNATGISVHGDVYASQPYPLEPYTPAVAASGGEAAPLVLILHTHGTECYAPPDMRFYKDGETSFRSEDKTESVIAVGEVLSRVLTEAGIPTLHCTVAFDAESYPEAYERAAAAIRRYLAEYPTLLYVFDVHRDALCRENGDEIKPVTEIGDELYAQIMIVVGTNEAGAVHPDWESNLTVAAHLQAALTDAYPDFARPLNLRAATFNEQYTKGSLLLEIGSCGNTLAEAKASAELLGRTLAGLILGQGIPGEGDL